MFLWQNQMRRAIHSWQNMSCTMTARLATKTLHPVSTSEVKKTSFVSKIDLTCGKRQVQSCPWQPRGFLHALVQTRPRQCVTWVTAQASCGWETLGIPANNGTALERLMGSGHCLLCTIRKQQYHIFCAFCRQLLRSYKRALQYTFSSLLSTYGAQYSFNSFKSTHRHLMTLFRFLMNVFCIMPSLYGKGVS